MTRSYYAVLGIEEDADADAVARAYRERAKAVHPDRSDDPDAAERFREVVRARDVLSDPVERARYDRLGHGAYVGAAPADAPDREAATARPREPTARRRDRRDRGRSTASTAGAGPAHARRAGEATGWADEWAGTGPSRRAAAAGRRGTLRGALLGVFTPGKGALAMVAFVLHPLFLAGTVYPVFPPGVKVAVGAAALVLLAVLLTVPEVGVVVFGGWTLLMPLLLLGTGVGWLSLVGAIAVAVCVVPFTLSALTLTMLRP